MCKRNQTNYVRADKAKNWKEDGSLNLQSQFNVPNEIRYCLTTMFSLYVMKDALSSLQIIFVYPQHIATKLSIKLLPNTKSLTHGINHQKL